jgi:hypothetical protein
MLLRNMTGSHLERWREPLQPIRITAQCYAKGGEVYRTTNIVLSLALI